MTYALIDYYNTKWSRKIKIVNQVGEVDIFVPHFRIKSSSKYGKKVLKILNEYEIKNVVISNNIINNRLFCDVLYDNKKNIITGRNMYKCLILRILKDVSFQMNVDLQKLKVVLLVEDFTTENNDLIKTIAKEVKSLTIVTTDKDKYDMLVKKLFNDYGIVLKVVEKNVKSIKYAHILFNVDFPSYDMNKINFSNNSLIFCGVAKHYRIQNNFGGIIITDVDIIDSNNHNENIDDLSLCEAKIYSYIRKIKENDKVFEKNGFRINGYFGLNGKIRTDEFKKLGKIILDK